MHHSRLFLTTEQTDFFIVHWFGFIFDLTVGFWMLFDKTRIPAMVFCTAFHLMNSRLFSIGKHSGSWFSSRTPSKQKYSYRYEYYINFSVYPQECFHTCALRQCRSFANRIGPEASALSSNVTLTFHFLRKFRI